MNISPAEAVRRYNVSKPTLYADMKEGKLSFSVDEKKRRRINVAEMERLYDTRTESREEDFLPHNAQKTHLNVNPQQDNTGALEREIEFLKRELENKQSENENWQKALDKAQETAQRVTLLLEDKSKEKDNTLEQSLKALESRVANQERDNKEEKERAQKILRQNQQLKKALEAEKSKSLWQKLFG
jgi:hypothetical protein